MYEKFFIFNISIIFFKELNYKNITINYISALYTSICYINNLFCFLVKLLKITYQYSTENICLSLLFFHVKQKIKYYSNSSMKSSSFR